MKLISKIATTVCSITIALIAQTSASIAQVQAPDPVNLTEQLTIKIDNLGDATWEMVQNMTQSQWENFKGSQLMNDPSIAKRNLERSLSTYVIEDFNRTVDEMNRSFTMTFKVKAMAQYNGSGNWTFKLDSKNPQVSKLADNSYMMTSNMYIGNALTQQTYKIYFPDGASNIQQTTDSFGKAIFTYSRGGGLLSYFSWNNILGVLLIAAAIVIVVRQQKSAPPQPKIA
ncbi:MAG TPA: hypothetical protein VFE53_27080 [Mucilaginibacter sp.]|jgi:hypothetical protein|nr:hypothetical protein [Mucilaginibacter sp.]